MSSKFFNMSVLLIVCTLDSFSQHHKITLSESNLYSQHYDFKQTENSSSDNISNKGTYFYITPMLGYYFLVDSTSSVGIEVGHTNVRAKVHSDYNLQSVRFVLYDTLIYNALNVSLNFQEEFHFRKYRFAAAVTIPFEWRYQYEIRERSLQIDRNSSTLNSYTLSTSTKIKSFNSGVYLRAGLNRLIYKNLYIGAQFQIGILRAHYYGDAIDSSVRFSGSNRQEFTSKIDFKKQNFVSHDMYSSLCLSYYF